MRKTYRRRIPSKQLNYPVNERIRSEKVVVIDEGKNLGTLSRDEALLLAREKELDLVLVAPKSNPPVAKLIDQGKFKYEQEKLLQKQKAKQKKVEIKGIRLSFKIGKHDEELKKAQALKFLEKGHKVRIEMLLRGREKRYRILAKENMHNFIKQLGDDVNEEQGINFQGAKLSAIVAKK